ncbi:MAG: hypothetical protein WAU76_19285 [Candidatus Sulfotelmatobacter sp.]
MSMKGVTTCAVPECTGPITGFNNLCDKHKLPGHPVSVNPEGGTVHPPADTTDETMIVTQWYAEHEGEASVIFLNDWALGKDFSGRAGFEAELARQGFVNVRNVNLADRGDLQRLMRGKKQAMWGGPWRAEYPWEPGMKLHPIEGQTDFDFAYEFILGESVWVVRDLKNGVYWPIELPEPLTKQNWEEASVGVTRAMMKAGIVRDDSKIKFEGHPAGTKRVRTGAA